MARFSLIKSPAIHCRDYHWFVPGLVKWSERPWPWYDRGPIEWQSMGRGLGSLSSAVEDESVCAGQISWSSPDWFACPGPPTDHLCPGCSTSFMAAHCIALSSYIIDRWPIYWSSERSHTSRITDQDTDRPTARYRRLALMSKYNCYLLFSRDLLVVGRNACRDFCVLLFNND